MDIEEVARLLGVGVRHVRRLVADGRIPYLKCCTSFASIRSRSRAGLTGRGVLPVFGELPLGAITQLDVRAWVAELDAEGRAPATVQKAYQTLSKILRGAVDAGLIAQSPCRNIALPRVEREEMRFLTPAEVAALADAIDPRYRAMVFFDAYCGLRLGELAGLRRGRVDLLRRQVRVTEIAVEVKGELIFGPPKIRAGYRKVPVPRFVADEMAAHLEAYGEPNPDALVFVGADRRRTASQRLARPALASGDPGRRPRTTPYPRPPPHRRLAVGGSRRHS